MISRTSRNTTLSALAIATAMFVAPIAQSGGKPASLARQAASATAAESFSRIVVSYQPGTRRTASAQRIQFDQASKALGVGITQMRTLATGGALIRTAKPLDKAGLKALATQLMKDKTVLAVEPDRKVFPALVPNDPQYTQQWHYKNGPGGINAEPAWDLSTGAGIVVAVIDTGITPHPDLTANIVAGYDFISEDAPGVFDTAADGNGRDSDPNDPGDFDTGQCGGYDSSWHGTHVAGTIAAVTNNNVGVSGVAFGAKVQPLRGLGQCGGYSSDISDAVVWASGGTVPGVPANATPAEVINLSLGGGGACSVAEQAAYDIAIANGSTVVVAAGNSGADVANYSPASCDGVIAVSAVGPTGTLAGYSNFGSLVSVAAPGGSGANPAADNVLSTLNLGATVQGAPGYAWYAGTSMASPHVAGIVALMQSVAPTALTPVQVKKILENTAYSENGATAGCTVDEPCGAGNVDARKAVAVANGSETLPGDPPPPPPPPPAIPLTNGVTVTGISVETDGNVVYELNVPAGATALSFVMAGSNGDADLYVRRGERPTNALYDCRPYTSTSNETCSFPTPTAGIWYARINGYSAATGLSLTGSYTGGGTAGPSALAVAPRRSKLAISWTGGASSVDIYKNAVIWKTTPNTGLALDSLFDPRSIVYKVCNAGTQQCSAEVTKPAR